MMMEAAAKAASEEGGDLLLLAVTVLTSMDADQLASTGIAVDPEAQVLRLAGLAHQSGIGGIVCSPKEIGSARASFGEGLRIVTPGVRPIWAAAGDQKRIMTPRDAVQAGADWLVIGRPITAADHPKEAYAQVVAELASFKVSSAACSS
jgi:orotidine-5'-phosphate decarboxylase